MTFPYQVSIDDERRTIIIRGAGSATTEDTLAVIDQARPHFKANPGYHVLYDSTELAIESHASDMVRVAETLFGGVPGPCARFAVVVPERRAHLGMMFTALAKNHGVDAAVFTDLGDAWRWLEPEPGTA